MVSREANPGDRTSVARGVDRRLPAAREREGEAELILESLLVLRPVADRLFMAVVNSNVHCELSNVQFTFFTSPFLLFISKELR